MEKQAAKKPRGRRAYLNQFRQDASGKYVYAGPHYVYADQQLPLRKRLAILWLLALALAADVVVQGCLKADGIMNCLYVLLPYLGEVFGAGSLLWALIQLTLADQPLRAYIYESTAARLPQCALLTLIAAGLTLLGELVYLLLRGMHAPEQTIWLLVLLAAAAAPALLLRRLAGQPVWLREEAAKRPPASRTAKS